jgi:hypothetical protein
MQNSKMYKKTSTNSKIHKIHLIHEKILCSHPPKTVIYTIKALILSKSKTTITIKASDPKNDDVSNIFINL